MGTVFNGSVCAGLGIYNCPLDPDFLVNFTTRELKSLPIDSRDELVKHG